MSSLSSAQFLSLKLLSASTSLSVSIIFTMLSTSWNIWGWILKSNGCFFWMLPLKLSKTKICNSTLSVSWNCCCNRRNRTTLVSDNALFFTHFTGVKQNVFFCLISFSLTDSEGGLPYDKESMAIIHLNNTTVMYLKEVTKFLAMVCFLRKESFERKGQYIYIHVRKLAVGFNSRWPCPL